MPSATVAVPDPAAVSSKGNQSTAYIFYHLLTKMQQQQMVTSRDAQNVLVLVLSRQNVLSFWRFGFGFEFWLFVLVVLVYFLCKFQVKN
jgi:hypothetical protein